MIATLKLPIYTKEFLKVERFHGALYFSMVTYKGLEKTPLPFKNTKSHSPQKYWIFFPPWSFKLLLKSNLPCLIGRLHKRTNEVASLPFLSLVCGSPNSHLFALNRLTEDLMRLPCSLTSRRRPSPPLFPQLSRCLSLWSLLPFSLPCSCSLPSSKFTSLAELSYPQLLTLRKADKLPANPDWFSSDCCIKPAVTRYLARLSQEHLIASERELRLFCPPQGLHTQTFRYQDRLWSCLCHNTVSCHLLP